MTDGIRRPEAAASRGDEARRILDSQVFRDSLASVAGRAVERMKSARTPEEAWSAVNAWRASEEALAFLRATIALGQSAVSQIQRDHEKLVQAQEAQDDLAGYLRKAVEAREAWDSRGDGSEPNA